jgi:hypothetical protein
MTMQSLDSRRSSAEVPTFLPTLARSVFRDSIAKFHSALMFDPVAQLVEQRTLIRKVSSRCSAMLVDAVDGSAFERGSPRGGPFVFCDGCRMCGHNSGTAQPEHRPHRAHTKPFQPRSKNCLRLTSVLPCARCSAREGRGGARRGSPASANRSLTARHIRRRRVKARAKARSRSMGVASPSHGFRAAARSWSADAQLSRTTSGARLNLVVSPCSASIRKAPFGNTSYVVRWLE